MFAAAEVVRSRSNRFIKRLRQLKESTGDGGGLVLLEGPRLLQEALRSGIEMVEVAATPSFGRGHRGRRLARELSDEQIPVRWVHEEVFDTLSEVETSQGVLGLARRPAFTEEQIFAGADPLVVVAVAVQDPGNLGGLLRTAEAAGATGAVLTKGCADPLSWKALRGSMGSALRLPHLRELSLDEVWSRLEARDIHTVATAVDGTVPYYHADLRRPLALLVGSEGAGLAEDVLHRTETVVCVPMNPNVDSLNVGVAAGIVLFEAARQRRI